MPITKQHVEELSRQTNEVIWLIGTLITILFVLNSVICLSFFLLQRKLLPWHKKGVEVLCISFQKQVFRFQQWDGDKPQNFG